VAANPATNLIYVVNHEGNTVTVIDGTQGKALATVEVGKRPQGITIDAKANRIYVANVHGDSVSVIDGAQNAVIETLRTGHNPYALVANERTARLYTILQSEIPFTVTDLEDK